MRVFAQREIVRLLIGNAKGGLQRYLSTKNIQPYLPEQFKSLNYSQSIHKFRISISPVLAQGFVGNDCIDICRMYSSSR